MHYNKAYKIDLPEKLDLMSSTINNDRQRNYKKQKGFKCTMKNMELIYQKELI